MIYLNSTDLFILGILGLILIFVLAIGIERMLKIIIGNYLLIAISIGINLGLQILIYAVDQGLIHFQNPDRFINFVMNSSGLINLLVYFILLIWIFFNSKLGIVININFILKRILAIILAPFTTVSIFTSLTIAVLGPQILQPDYLINFANQFKQYPIIYKIILAFPLWLILPGLITIIFSTRFSLPKFNLNLLPKRKKKDEHHEEEHTE